MRPGNAIQAPDTRAPLAIALPWHEHVAALLERAERWARATGVALKMRGRPGGSGNGVSVQPPPAASGRADVLPRTRARAGGEAEPVTGRSRRAAVPGAPERP